MTDDPRALALDARLRSVVAHAPGRVSLAVRLPDGEAVDIDAERVVPAASTIKVPLLVAALQHCQDGRLDLDGPVPLPAPAGRVGGCGPVELLPSVTALPLREVLTVMICLSDNDATNAVIDLLGPAAVTPVLEAVPMRRTQLQRRLMDFGAAAQGRQNLTCAADLADLLVALRQGRLLDRGHTDIALGILRRQQFLEGLPAYLPEGLLVASKTGAIVGVRADLALIERPPAGSSDGGAWAVVAIVATGLEEGEGRGCVDRGTAVLPVFAEVGEAVAQLVVSNN